MKLNILATLNLFITETLKHQENTSFKTERTLSEMNAIEREREIKKILIHILECFCLFRDLLEG